MANSTVVINLKHSPYNHNHRDIASGYIQNNRTRFFSLCKATLGTDYTTWPNHRNRSKVEELAHDTIYGKTVVHGHQSYQSYKTQLKNSDETALKLQINYLVRAKFDLKRQANRQNCYEQVVASAIDAGVITADEVLNWR
jgi:hypothetical protein